MTSLLSLFGFAVLVLLPGAWVTYLLPLAGFSGLLRLLIGVALAPVVVLVQFYALRLTGLTFETAAAVLPVINLPVLYWMRRFLAFPQRPEWRKLVPVLLVAGIGLGFLWYQFRDPAVRAYTGHSWLQTDVIYQIANGKLLPEDADVAGLKLGYPWAMHVYHAVLTYTLGTAPVANYHWLNLILLAAISGMLLELVGSLGGGFAARLASVPLLFFGVNFTGYVLQHYLKADQFFHHNVWGDYRYTPWVFYFFFFSMVPSALALFSASAVVCVRALRTGLTADVAILVALLVCPLGILYAMIAPAAWVLFGVFALWTLWTVYRRTGRLDTRTLGLAAAILISAVLVTAGFQAILTKDRAAAGLIAFSPLRHLAGKAMETALVFFPVWIALPFVIRRLWRKGRDAAVLLLGAGVLNCLIYAVFIVNAQHPWNHIEYKFVLCAAIVLTPFAALLVERVIAARAWAPAPAILLLTLLLAAPFAEKIARDWPWTATWTADGVFTGRGGAPLDLHSFSLALAPEDPRSGLYKAVETLTPSDTILVISDAYRLQVPTLTRRALYVAPYEKEGKPGLAGDIDGFLFEIKGYSRALVAERRKIVEAVYSGADDQARAAALSRILELHRPVAIAVDERRFPALQRWLAGGHAHVLHRGSPETLWMLDSIVDSPRAGVRDPFSPAPPQSLPAVRAATAE